MNIIKSSTVDLTCAYEGLSSFVGKPWLPPDDGPLQHCIIFSKSTTSTWVSSWLVTPEWPGCLQFAGGDAMLGGRSQCRLERQLFCGWWWCFSGENDHGRHLLPPEVIGFNSVLSACEKCSEWQDAMELLTLGSCRVCREGFDWNFVGSIGSELEEVLFLLMGKVSLKKCPWEWHWVHFCREWSDFGHMNVIKLYAYAREARFLSWIPIFIFSPVTDIKVQAAGGSLLVWMMVVFV